jgi:hypothetical protein
VSAAIVTAPVPAVPTTMDGGMRDLTSEGRLAGAHLAVALVALLGGVTTGLAQALEYAGIDLYPHSVIIKSYYHGLSIHGVLNCWCGRRSSSAASCPS